MADHDTTSTDLQPPQAAPLDTSLYFEATVRMRYEGAHEWYADQGLRTRGEALAAERGANGEGDYLLSMLSSVDSTATVRIVDTLDIDDLPEDTSPINTTPLDTPVYFEATVVVRYEVPAVWFIEQSITSPAEALASEQENIRSGDYLISMVEYANSADVIHLVDSLDLPSTTKN